MTTAVTNTGVEVYSTVMTNAVYFLPVTVYYFIATITFFIAAGFIVCGRVTGYAWCYEEGTTPTIKQDGFFPVIPFLCVDVDFLCLQHQLLYLL